MIYGSYYNERLIFIKNSPHNLQLSLFFLFLSHHDRFDDLSLFQGQVRQVRDKIRVSLSHTYHHSLRYTHARR